jgi:hypothetical protein
MVSNCTNYKVLYSWKIIGETALFITQFGHKGGHLSCRQCTNTILN